MKSRSHRHHRTTTLGTYPTPSCWYEWEKIFVDRVLALAGLIVLLPILLAIAVAIHLDSPGPVIYRQRRVGKDGREFTMYKFRTMVDGADEALHRAAFARFFQARSLEDVGTATFKLENDPRVTRVGRFLRSTSLDELPQLVNVLNGTMSLVGPRPPIPYETEMYERHHWQRLVVRPGITGPWQALARNRVPFEEMVAMDLDYIAQRSLGLDLKIMLLTVSAILIQQGAG